MTSTPPTPTHGEVLTVERVTRNLVRVVLGGPGLDGFVPTEFTDQYVNVLFPPPGAPYGVPFDVEHVRTLDPELRPRGRRYTIRSWDPTSRTLAIDFVVHGDVGYAGRWANHAQPGDVIQFTGPSGGYRPDPEARWYLLVGDETALPAIAASLEVLPSGTTARAVVVVDDADSELALASAADLECVWLHRSSGQAGPDQLVEAVRAVAAPLAEATGVPEVFVHGEAAEIRAVRRYLIGELGVPRNGASISPYWRRGDTDEAWRAVKREWVSEMLADV